jgi:hypothetical protein
MSTSSVIISSRSTDLLDKLGLPVFILDELDKGFVDAELTPAMFSTLYLRD